MTVVHPIPKAWLSTVDPRTGRSVTGAQNYDEFADDAEITALIAESPLSALGVEMPHKAPDSLGLSFTDALPAAVERLAAAKAAGAYAESDDVVVLYRITGPDGAQGFGLWCLVDTDQISTSADEPGLVIRNEDVFIAKVRERVALFQATGHLLSPVLLLQTGRGDELHAALDAACAGAGAPFSVDVDPAGRTHEIWPVTDGAELRALAGGGDLVVADGNHRSLAAQTGDLPRFLAVVTTPGSVAIQPYNRLVHELTTPVADLIEGLQQAGAVVAEASGPVTVPATGGSIGVYAGDRGYWTVELPRVEGASSVENLDHALVEKQLFGEQLGLDPGDKRITYVGGDYPASWLAGEVDAGRAELAILIAPVTVDDFVAVNLARLKLPRKSTWFTPKARAGLVAVEL
ncbi:uncharacterized protein (DUF1015 family) [Allocatelliglobosispora scoriae]|uniref:Uncharacterized protein (DUF1015 family) n=1 Tax=Allocatelliglobosispora scoriae TaxID=643052 RepID=A0A841BNK8_9ACTN|nr:DUF1015 family protein [Allocatelliglobosispora scoriae]MBB5869854.1 uncharacterized protein (DUF1015 family) [Allocatelliglobosispora scoriae]